jgi:hypothetical protein
VHWNREQVNSPGVEAIVQCERGINHLAEWKKLQCKQRPEVNGEGKQFQCMNGGSTNRWPNGRNGQLETSAVWAGNKPMANGNKCCVNGATVGGETLNVDPERESPTHTHAHKNTSDPIYCERLFVGSSERSRARSRRAGCLAFATDRRMQKSRSLHLHYLFFPAWKQWR